MRVGVAGYPHHVRFSATFVPCAHCAHLRAGTRRALTTPYKDLRRLRGETDGDVLSGFSGPARRRDGSSTRVRTCIQTTRS